MQIERGTEHAQYKVTSPVGQGEARSSGVTAARIYSIDPDSALFEEINGYYLQLLPSSCILNLKFLWKT
jgi:hypothetical protein